MRYFLFCLFISIILSNTVFAQDNVMDKMNKNVKNKQEQVKSQAEKLKDNFFDTGIKEPSRYVCLQAFANTNGWSGGIMYGRKKNKSLTHWYSLSLSEIKHDKEEKLKPNTFEVQGYGKPIPYIYGKQNSFYTLNIGYAQDRILLHGFILPSVNLSMVYGINFSLGMLKPYYLQLKKVENGILSIQQQKYSLENADTFLTSNKIYSRSKFSYGLNETNYIPGVHLHIAIQFDIGSGTWVKAIRIGGSASFYAKKIPIMIQQKQSSNFFNLFMGLVIGNEW